MKSAHKVDMTKGKILPQVLVFAFPLLVSSFLQQLFNSADSAVVGRFAGSMALAAVGSNSSVINLLLNLFIGLSIGANVVVARLLGEKREDRVREAVPTLMVTGFVCGIIMAILGNWISRPLLEFISSPEEIIDMAALYLRIYFSGMPFMMVYNFGSAILRSYGDTERPLYALFLSGIINVILNVIFVVGFHMSVAGVGIATVISNAIAGGVVFVMLVRHEGPIRWTLKGIPFDKESFLKMLRVGLPAGIQGVLFSVSNVTILSAINSFGAYAAAGSATTSLFEALSYFIITAFVQAAVTFTSQNYGAKEYQRCKDAYRIIFWASFIATLVFDVVVVLFRVPLISIFTTDAEAIRYGSIKIVVGLSLHTLVNTYEISGGCLRGLGKSVLPTVLTLICCCAFRLFWVFFILPLNHTFAFMMAVYPISWVLAGFTTTIALYKVRKQLFV